MMVQPQPSIIRGSILLTTRTQAIGRAVDMINYPSRYHLGSGGSDPGAISCFVASTDGVGQCDCSGFVAWCLGYDRWQKRLYSDRDLGEYVSTDSMVEDANRHQILFRRTSNPRAGDLICYPGKRNHGRRVHIGHVGILIQPPNAPGPSVIDCASGKDRRSAGISVARRSIATWIGKPDWCYLEYTRWSA